jgi:hypothetical protein
MSNAAVLPQVRNARSLFPTPEDGALMEVSPPPFAWLAVDGVSEYRLIVEKLGGETVLEEKVTKNIFVPKKRLEPGKYRWDVAVGGQRRGWWGFTVSADAVTRIVPTAAEVLAKVPAAHPRLIYLPGDAASIVERHAHKIPTLKRNIELAYKDGFVPRPMFHRNDIKESNHLNDREALGRHRVFVDRNLVSCALGYQLLGDKKAGEFARASLLEMCDWNPDGPISVDGPWGDEIGLGHARCMPLVYDWTYDLYTKQEHIYICDTLAHMGRNVKKHLDGQNFCSNPGSSHAGRMPAYLGNIALVLQGHTTENTQEWLQFALDVYGSFFPHFGTRDGGWAEGTFYATSYTKWYLPFFFSIERIAGFSFTESPFYWRVSQFFTHFSPPGWEIHPFCDGYWSLPDSTEWPGFYAQDPFGVYAERFGPELARTFSRELGVPEIFKLHLLDAFPPAYTPKRPNAAGPVENAREFRDTGFVSMHSDIEHPKEDTALLVRATKYGNTSHRHADQGAFAIMSRGKGLLTPTGYFGFTYGTKHHFKWTNETVAHNCVLVDGKGQPSRDFSATGSIETFENHEKFATTSVDITPSYGQTKLYRRKYALIRPGLVLVHDFIETEKPSSYAWLAHSLSKPTDNDGVIAIDRAPASLRMVLLHPDTRPQYSMTDRFGVDVNEGVPKANHVSFPDQFHMRWDVPTGSKGRFLAVIAVNGDMPEIKRNGSSVRINYKGVDVSADLLSGEIAIA